MPEKWTGEVIGLMHNNRISFQMLADRLGWHVKYLSAVLNSKRKPIDAEEKVKSALQEILAELPADQSMKG